ncbi:hypothetical protein EJB05_18838, partial [Eragrostis curvula]
MLVASYSRQSVMASISCCTTSLPVNLRRPALLFQQQAPTTTAGRSRRWLISCAAQTNDDRSGRGSHVVPASAVAKTDEAATGSVQVGDMERGSLAEKSGRSDGQLTERWREIHGSNNWEGLLDPLDTVLRGELIRYGEFAQACYDAFDYDRFSPYCGTCRYAPSTFFRDVGLEGVGYEVTRYLYATSNLKFPNFFDSRHAESSQWSENAAFIGFVAVSTDEETARIGRRDIAVAWRGTVTKLEWVSDLTALQMPVAELGVPCPDRSVKVEEGFGELYAGKDPGCRWCRYSAREQVLAEVRKLVELYHARGEEVSVTVTGHSLGSALAMLSAFDIAETEANVTLSSEGENNNKKKAPVCVYSFSGPRVGNPRFKDRFERDLGVRCLRIVNVHDTVPRAPGAFLLLPWFDERMLPEFALRLLDTLGSRLVYTHLGVELALDHKVSPFLKDTLDLACYHNLEAHLHLLDGYQARGMGFQLCGRDPALVNKAADFLRDDHRVPPVWRQDANKGMVRTDEGRWVLPPRERELHDHPEDTEQHLQKLGLLSN